MEEPEAKASLKEVRIQGHHGVYVVDSRLLHGTVNPCPPPPWYRRGLPTRLKATLAFCALFYAGYHLSGGTMNGPAATIFGALAGFALFVAIIGDR